MRLAILLSMQSPWSRDVAIHLSKAGHAVHVLALRSSRTESGDVYLPDVDLLGPDYKRLESSVAGVHFLDSRLRSHFRYLFSASTLRKVLRQVEAEALLCIYAGGFATMALASRFRPYAVYVVGSDVLMSRGIKRKITQTALNAASQVFVNGTYLTEKTRELAPASRLAPLYIGVDTSRFAPRIRPPRPVRIVCTRGFLPVYNNEYIIQALSQMPDTGVEFNVTFAAGGSLLESSRHLADKLLPPRLRGCVEFLGGVSHERLRELVGESHIYVSTSRSDGASLSLMEALASGLFPVLSDIPQNREWIGSDSGVQNGILVPLDRPDVLAKELHTAITNEQWRNKVAVYNRELALTRADCSRNMTTLATILDNIVRQDQQREYHKAATA